MPAIRLPTPALAAGPALALALLAAGIARVDFVIDDAYISFRYARNWAEWGVPAYNPGESPPVEGYSNLAWVALLRWAHELGFPLPATARVLGWLCGAGTLIWLALFARRALGLGRSSVTLACLLLAAFPPFVLWCSGGLETALFGLLVFGTWATLADPRGRPLARGALAGCLAVALAATRPEGAAWALAALAGGLVARAGSWRERGRLAGVFLALLALGVALLLAWRRAVHEAWLPNTVQAKAAFSGAVLERGARTAASYLVLFVTPLIALAAPLLVRRARRAMALGAWLVLVAALAECVLVGGDWMPMFRLLAPASVFVALCLVLVLERLPRPAAWMAGGALALCAALPLMGRSVAPRAWREALYFRSFRKGYETEWERWRSGVENVAHFLAIGEGLARVAAPGSSITLGAIGAVGWASRLVVHDRNGLVDREVARRAPLLEHGTAGHDKRVPRAFFAEREPTYWEARLIEGAVPSLESPAGRQAARAIAAHLEGEDRALLARARPELHVLPGEPARTLVLLRRVEDPSALELWRALGL